MSKVLAIVDPLSTGTFMAVDARDRGFEVIAVWSRDVLPENRRRAPGMTFLAEIDEKRTVAETAQAIQIAVKGKTLEACMVGAEDGVTLADVLSLELGLRSNGIFPGGPRRNKNVQQLAVKAAGMRAVREAIGTTWTDVSDFVAQEPLPVVVKPVESAGSDGVKLCTSLDETKQHFEHLMTSQRRVGSQGAAVLCQEFLKGKEYAVDQVSRDGVHKTIMVWVYDKRPANGAAFVYYGMLPVDPSTEEAQKLVKYANGVLDAIQLNNGPTHMEIMMTAQGPCLVEVNCRCAGADGSISPVARALTGGYAQADVALHCFLDENAWNEIPLLPRTPFKATGQQVALVSFASGTVRRTPGYDKIRKMKSFVDLLTGIKVGSKVDLTVDVFTAAGFAVMAHTDPKVVEADMAEIRRLERECLLFEFDADVDPAQCYPSKDTVIPDGRRRTSTMDSTMLPNELKPKSRGLHIEIPSALVIFGFGVLFGLALARPKN